MGDRSPHRRIDMVIPGLDDDRPLVPLARRHRLQRASGVGDRRGKEARVAMLLDLATRMHYATLRAIRDDRVTVTQAYDAYRQGPAALDALLKESEGVLLWPLCKRFAHEGRHLKEMPYRLQTLERFCEALGGTDHVLVSHFTTERIRTWLASVDAYDVATKQRKAPSASTLNGYRVALSTFATWLLQLGYIDRHPIAHRLVPKRDLPSHRMPAPFTAQDYVTYRKTAFAHHFGAGVLLTVALHTGADRGELHQKLQVRDIRYGEHGQPTRVRLQRPKWKKARERFVPIPTEVAALLKTQCERAGVTGEELVFADVPAWAVTVAHRKAREALGRPSLRIKDLRHIAAMRWVQSGVNIQQVRYRLGHSTLAQTAVYVDYAPNDDAHSVEQEATAWLTSGRDAAAVEQLVTETTTLKSETTEVTA